MTTLDPNLDHCVFINTFHVAPDDADRLLASLAQTAETAFRRQPGFISASFHLSLDGTKVVNYAQWRSFDDLFAMLKDPSMQPHIEEAAAIARSLDPVVYRLVSTHGA